MPVETQNMNTRKTNSFFFHELIDHLKSNTTSHNMYKILNLQLFGSVIIQFLQVVNLVQMLIFVIYQNILELSYLISLLNNNHE
jgi:hypothetical protein